MDTQVPESTGALIAFGANQPHAGKSLQWSVESARSQLGASDVTLRRASALYATPCFPKGAGPDFVNACALYDTTLPPDAFLDRIAEVEAKFGRVRTQRWSARTLDIDLLAMGDLVRPDKAVFERWAGLPVERQIEEAPDELIVPHPRLHERGFVLVPLAEIAPGWRHPVFARTVAQMLAALPAAETADIRRL